MKANCLSWREKAYFPPSMAHSNVRPLELLYWEHKPAFG
jgi:hypothetical protein